MTEPYRPCAYLLEEMPPGVARAGALAFQYPIAPDLPRLCPADGWSAQALQDWLTRCCALELRPHLMLVAADSPLAAAYSQLRTDRPGLAEAVHWLFWPPQPEATMRVLRDPDDGVLAVLAGAFNGAPPLPPLRAAAATWPPALLLRVERWLEDHADALAGSLGLADSFGQGPAAAAALRASALTRLRDWLQPADVTPLPLARSTRRVLLDETLFLLAASDPDADGPLRRNSSDGSWSVSNEHIPGESGSQFLIFRCNAAAALRWQGCEVEIQIGAQLFALGPIDRHGVAELRIPRRVDLRQPLQVRIVHPSA